jgi:hypothetical protein
MITAEFLRQVLSYDSDTGIFRWNEDRGRGAKKGDIAGSSCDGFRNGGGGYTYIGVAGKTYSAHRLAWLYVYGEFPSEQIDHVNMDRRDNRITNLRKASRVQNMGNRARPRNNTSGAKGVSFNKNAGKWLVSIQVAKKPMYIGLFVSKENAMVAYELAAYLHHGEFARA